MNKKLSERAEMLLVMQECEVYTDQHTLNAAKILAHHGKRFQHIHHNCIKFDELSAMMRQKFPECPCQACIRSRQS